MWTRCAHKGHKQGQAQLYVLDLPFAAVTRISAMDVKHPSGTPGDNVHEDQRPMDFAPNLYAISKKRRRSVHDTMHYFALDRKQPHAR